MIVIIIYDDAETPKKPNSFYLLFIYAKEYKKRKNIYDTFIYIFICTHTHLKSYFFVSLSLCLLASLLYINNNNNIVIKCK